MGLQNDKHTSDLRTLLSGGTCGRQVCLRAGHAAAAVTSCLTLRTLLSPRPPNSRSTRHLLPYNTHTRDMEWKDLTDSSQLESLVVLDFPQSVKA